MAQMLGFRDFLQSFGVPDKVSPPPAMDDEGSELNLDLNLSIGSACASHSENKKDDCLASLVVESRDNMTPQQKRKELQAWNRQKARKKLDMKRKLQRGHCRGSSVPPCTRSHCCNAIVGFCVGKDDRRALESQTSSVRQRERKEMMPQRQRKRKMCHKRGEEEERERKKKKGGTKATSSTTIPILPISYPYPPPPIPVPMGFPIRYMLPLLAPTEPFNAIKHSY